MKPITLYKPTSVAEATQILAHHGPEAAVYAGINANMIESRGKILLVVDNTYASQLASELTRLQQDLVGDGWTVVRRDVSRSDSVAPNIRAALSGWPCAAVIAANCSRHSATP